MSHQTGIQANDELLQFISRCKIDGETRVFKVSILEEQLTLGEHRSPVGNWQQDYKRYVGEMLVGKQPCYLLFRLDTINSSNLYEWLLICWSPEDSPVRQKMLYASTKATLKTTFGSASIVSDYFATNKEEMSLDHIKNEKKNDEQIETNNVELLTAKEQDLKSVKRSEALSSSIHSTRTLPGLQFPLTDELVDALFELKDGLISYICLAIDLDKEEITLETKENHKEFEISDMPKKISNKNARYHILLYPHTHEGVFTKSVIFIYSVPGESCSVKERMLYSSCKNALVTAIQDESKFGIEISRRLECDDPNELTIEFFLNELHPKENTAKSKFEKPKGPMGKRGARRLIKTNDES
ncbi:protein tyrosine kinase 9/actin monomer-binding protein-like protein [Dinothrombium tinctorium]|uniref:Twinfilin n=1 Tax=Dinothrombium tinctorium TaxID=1965070 RepID=A0A3S3QD14_9ACAR|nr:protein tyrosine kinase 9/actin monomer-binding protein-like protein [Dinothrombium tinctorium]